MNWIKKGFRQSVDLADVWKTLNKVCSRGHLMNSLTERLAALRNSSPLTARQVVSPSSGASHQLGKVICTIRSQVFNIRYVGIVWTQRKACNGNALRDFVLNCPHEGGDAEESSSKIIFFEAKWIFKLKFHSLTTDMSMRTETYKNVFIFFNLHCCLIWDLTQQSVWL